MATPAPTVHQAQVFEMALSEAGEAADSVAPMSQAFSVRNVKNRIAAQPKSLNPGEGRSRWARRSNHGMMAHTPNRRLTTSKHNWGPSIPRRCGGNSLSNWYSHKKYHSGLMPGNAGASGSAFSPNS